MKGTWRYFTDEEMKNEGMQNTGHIYITDYPVDHSDPLYTIDVFYGHWPTTQKIAKVILDNLNSVEI